MSKQLTPRGRALRWLTNHRGITEQPAGSNSDRRQDGIRAAQRLCANGGTWLDYSPWCGSWAYAAAYAGGVRPKNPGRWASVAFIEDDARNKTNGFRGWTTDHSKALRGDLVVLFGRGVHVETVRAVFRAPGSRRYGYVLTDGGNTSSGNGGSQDNGGGAFRRWRRFSDVRGYALVNYPG